MITPHKIRIAIVLAQLCVFQGTAQSVISNDAAICTNCGPGIYLTLTQSINADLGRPGLFAIEIKSLGASQYSFSYAGIAEEYALFAVTSGMIIDPTFTASTIPLVSNNGVDPGSSLQTFPFGQSRYFGYWDDGPLYRNDNDDGTPDIHDIYGWVLITRTASGLQATSSATALGGGIIAGTLTPVPEPSVTALLSFSAILLLGLRRFGFRSHNT